MLTGIRHWAAVHRTRETNLRLGAALAFVAGAINAGGFLAVGRYTSHMTGIVSGLADDLVLGRLALAGAAAGMVVAFVSGAATTAVVVNWSLRRGLKSAYALPLLIEAALLLVFGLFGATMGLMATVLVPLTVLLLCYVMGLQNAVITKMSRAEIRTTHVTGLLTDLGIESGKWLYRNLQPDLPPVRADRSRLRLHALLVASFFAGGLVGATGFQSLGYATTVPLAALLLLLAVRPVWEDLRRTPR